MKIFKTLQLRLIDFFVFVKKKLPAVNELFSSVVQEVRKFKIEESTKKPDPPVDKKAIRKTVQIKVLMCFSVFAHLLLIFDLIFSFFQLQTQPLENPDKAGMLLKLSGKKWSKVWIALKAGTWYFYSSLKVRIYRHTISFHHIRILFVKLISFSPHPNTVR